MRLLRTDTLKVREFYGDAIPTYAILSHTWEEDGEITLQELLDQSNQDKSGWVKVRKFCAFVLKKGFQWCWIDTCCIDKKSSAELSEAINSMFRWYWKAEICYAYLADVQVNESTTPNDSECQMQNSRWFTRGWTLQELLAPREVHFIDRDWSGVFATKKSMCQVISLITHIPANHILKYKGSTVLHSGTLSREVLRERASVAQIMSWAAERNVTREEDAAYSLLGLFGINMPLLYGESAAAFIRLQHEIVKVSDDQSIFAWGYRASSIGPKQGLFANSIKLFKDCDFIPKPQNLERDQPSKAISTTCEMTQKGLKFSGLRYDLYARSLNEVPYEDRKAQLYVLGLDCATADTSDVRVRGRKPAWLGIPIKWVPERHLYQRLCSPNVWIDAQDLFSSVYRSKKGIQVEMLFAKGWHDTIE